MPVIFRSELADEGSLFPPTCTRRICSAFTQGFDKNPIDIDILDNLLFL